MPRPPEIDPGLLELLVCPVTKGPLEYDRGAGELISRGAGLAFPIRDGIPIMLIDEARPLDRPARPHWPTELAYSREDRVLRVVFNDGAEFLLPAELLRVESPSAEVQGHGPEGKRIVAGRAGVAIAEIIPEGNYAVRLVFDDGHDTGIYSWTCLREFGERKDALWAAYLEALRDAGLSR